MSRTVAIAHPMIIAFAPPAVKRASDPASTSALAHLEYAVSDTVSCLKPASIAVANIYADRITLKNGSASESIALRGKGQAIGALLVEPGRKAQVVFSEVGPSALQLLLPQAASHYWNVKACAR